jgi:hypothetical protein
VDISTSIGKPALCKFDETAEDVVRSGHERWIDEAAVMDGVPPGEHKQPRQKDESGSTHRAMKACQIWYKRPKSTIHRMFEASRMATANHRIFGATPIPRYVQLAELIRQRVAKGHWPRAACFHPSSI